MNYHISRCESPVYSCHGVYIKQIIFFRCATPGNFAKRSTLSGVSNFWLRRALTMDSSFAILFAIYEGSRDFAKVFLSDLILSDLMKKLFSLLLPFLARLA
jgi:hypothetical protein